MSEFSWVVIFLCLALVVPFASGESVMPFSHLLEADLTDSVVVTPYYIEALDTIAYYPNLDEPELVAAGCAYFAPIITFKGDHPVLMLNSIVALQGYQFGLRAIEFDFSESELLWDIDAFDASSEGFYAAEGFQTVGPDIFGPLIFVANNVREDLHVTFWGRGSDPLHFALTKNQKETIKLFVDLYIVGQVQSI